MLKEVRWVHPEHEAVWFRPGEYHTAKVFSQSPCDHSLQCMIVFVVLEGLPFLIWHNSALSQEWLCTEKLTFLWSLRCTERYLESLSHFIFASSSTCSHSIKIKDYKTQDNQPGGSRLNFHLSVLMFSGVDQLRFAIESSNSSHAQQASCSEVVPPYLTYMGPYMEGTIFAVHSLECKIPIDILWQHK